MDNTIEKLITMHDNEILNYFANIKKFEDLNEIYHNLRYEIDALKYELRPYMDAKEAAEKINATLFLPKGKNKWYDKNNAVLDLLLNIEKLYYQELANRKEICKHDFVQTGCCGYDRETEVYTCTKCGKKEYR